jgi:DNA mismatch repair protein MutL
MPKVLVLPEHIASQIAAGEVVERPASVVKELVENSLDAGATQIEIAISSQCRDIRIADNGCGMDPDDAVLAFQRHATSKIRSADDLWALRSFGFRGEALPSIASIARVSCTTRTRDAQCGVRIESADGKLTSVETGCAPGTVMEIQDLFYNVPARMNFLKKAATEFGHIQEIVQSLAVAHPEVAFHLLNQGQTSLKTTGSNDLSQTVAEAGLLSAQSDLYEIDYQDSNAGVRITGRVARPLHFRGDRKGILAMVNRRPVRCHLTYKALEYAYSDLIPRGRHPLAVVSIDIEPDRVDVNIHPTKKEIKYSSGNEVYLAIQRALVQALRREVNAQRELELSISEPAYDAPSNHPSSAENSPTQISFKEQLAYVPSIPRSQSVREQAPAGYDTSRARPSVAFNNVETQEIADASLAPSEDQDAVSVFETGLPADWRIAGYIHNTYIVIETGDGMILVEQHIAHERTLYERLLAAQTSAGRISDHSQRLIVSAPLALSPEQVATLEQHAPVLRKLGFDFDWTEDRTQAVCTEVPLELAYKNYPSVVQEMLDQFATVDSANIELEATKSIACQSAIKNGMPLSERQIVELLINWLATPRNDTCPHGRPIVLKMTHDKLFQLFHPA